MTTNLPRFAACKRAETRPAASGAPGPHDQVGEPEALQGNGLDAAGERLRRLPEQIGEALPRMEARGERPRSARTLSSRKISGRLGIVNHHQLLQRTQSRVRLGEACQALRVLQIEVVEGIGRYNLAGERGLAALPRTEQGHYAGCAVQRRGRARGR